MRVKKFIHTRLDGRAKVLLDRAFKIIPLTGATMALSYWTAKQIVSPHHRMVKMGVLGAVLIFMFRFDVIYSIILFTLIYPFPSGITIGSTNTLLMFLIGLTWAIRATSTGQSVYQPSRYDWAIVLLLIAYLLSFYNCENATLVRGGIRVFVKQIAAVVYFYLIIRFVDDERRLNLFTRVIGVMACFVAFTGALQLFFPGAQIIPGWINLPDIRGRGSLNFRIEGVRLGGAVGGHNLLSDITMVGMFYIVYHLKNSRNPLVRFLWGAGAVMTLMAMMGTANRGAAVSLILGAIYTVFRFRNRVRFTYMVVTCAVTLAVLIGAQIVLEEYTYAVSVYDRLVITKFSGIEPDTRAGIWSHTFKRSLEHPFVGHGPLFDPGSGIEWQYWPHNAYLYYLYTIGFVGLIGFLWVAFLVVRRSMIFRQPAIWRTKLGDLAMVVHIQVCVLLFSQIRTDHQRDELHIYTIWMVFGVVAATAKVIEKKLKAREAEI